MDVKPPISVPAESRPTAREVATWILSNCAARYVKPEGFSQSPQDVINFQIHMAEVKIAAYAASSSLLPVGRQLEPMPIPLNTKQQEVIHDWSDNNSIEYWGSSEAREHNLTIFARQIIANARGEHFDLQLMEDALFMAAAVDANSDRAERMRELGERIYKLKPNLAGLPVGESTKEKESEELQQYRKDWPLLLREIALVSDDEEWSGPDASWTEDDILECFDPWDTLRKLQAKRAVGGSRWISVEEKLPEQSDMYLVAAKPSATNNVPAAFDVFSAVWEDDVLPGESPKWLEVNDRWVVTHWQPLPKPPGCI